jgi:ABC-type dipeptide/oligopeptide/nickel transport system permease component
LHRAEYVVKRLAFAVMTVFVAITLNFVLFRALPGNAVADLARAPHASPQLRAALTHEFGLDKPLLTQYVLYLDQLVFHANMGISFADSQPVTSELTDKLKNTIPMVMIGTFLAIAIGIVTGFLSAWRRSGIVDKVSTNAAIVFYALPTQFIGMMLILLFAGTLPTAGMRNEVNNFFSPGDTLSNLKDIGLHMLLPAFTLALTLFGEYTLIVRSSMLETLGEDYVLTARAKGLPQRRIVVSHALRNAMLPIVTLVALSLGFIVAGAILVEIIYSWPGIGQAIYSAVSKRDYPMLQGAFLILTVSVVFFNFIADLIYFRLDPRITE